MYQLLLNFVKLMLEDKVICGILDLAKDTYIYLRRH